MSCFKEEKGSLMFYLLPTTQYTEIGWRARLSPPDHPANQYEFDTLLGADGKRNTLPGFKRKEFRGKLAIAITANFINKRSEAEARVQVNIMDKIFSMCCTSQEFI